jgi:O-antigen/teichoic acid export membrane protein
MANSLGAAAAPLSPLPQAADSDERSAAVEQAAPPGAAAARRLAPRTRLRRLLVLLWRSHALRTAVLYGVSGLGFTGANLILARFFPTVEFAVFSIALALLNLASPLAPAGADAVVNRHQVDPDRHLLRRGVATSAVVGLVTAAVGGVLYELTPLVMAIVFAGVVTGGMNVLAAAQFQSMRRFNVSLPLAHAVNFVTLLAALVTWGVGVHRAWLPLALLAAGRGLAAAFGWAKLGAEHALRPPSASARYPWRDALSLAGVGAAGLLLTQLDRLMIGQLLPARELATFGVLAAIVGSPFRVLQMGTGYTLLPRLRAAPDPRARRRLLLHEGIAVACMVAVACVTVWYATPLLVHYMLADKYQVEQALVVAALIAGMGKIVEAFAKTVVSALGDSRELTLLGLVSWGSVVAAVTGGVLGAPWGLLGVVYGVGAGWWLRALLTAWLSLPHLRKLPATAAPAR